MDILIYCIDSIAQLFTNPVMFSLLGLIAFGIVLSAFKILIKY